MILLKNYLVFSTIFVAIDSIYLNLASNFFKRQIKDIQGDNLVLKMFPTFLCYVFLTVGIYYFAIEKKLSIKDCFMLGLFVYGVYETTNMAIFKKWRWSTVIMDTVWGGVLSQVP